MALNFKDYERLSPMTSGVALLVIIMFTWILFVASNTKDYLADKLIQFNVVEAEEL
jgi:uncharacterized membrane protein